MTHIPIMVLSIVAMVCHSVSAQSGRVLDPSDKPIQAARITLLSTGDTQISGSDGSFSFPTSGTKSSKKHLVTSHVRIQNNGIIAFDNPRAQSVSLELFDLRGKNLKLLQAGTLQRGIYRFEIPALLSNQALLLRSRIGSTQQVHKIIGKTATLTKSMSLHRTPGHSFAKKSQSDTPPELLLITHSMYDVTTVPVTGDENELTVKMPYRKLILDTISSLKVKDTISNTAYQIRLVLDSIRDQRCACDLYCQEAGEALVYLTLITDSNQNSFSLSTYDRTDTTILGYQVGIEAMIPQCPQTMDDIDYDEYIVDIRIDREQSSDEAFLGAWVHQSYQTDGRILLRSDRLLDYHGGYRFFVNNTLVERKNSGWCGTPPIAYGNFDGTWEKTGDTSLRIITDYYGGVDTLDVEIVSVTESELRLRYE